MLAEPFFRLVPDGSGKIEMNSTMKVINTYENLLCKTHRQKIFEEDKKKLQNIINSGILDKLKDREFKFDSDF